jgi:hypothetical protein
MSGRGAWLEEGGGVMPKASNPVAYAEDTLGVHEILAGVIATREKLDKEILTTWANARDAKRKAESDLEDREMELVIAERGKHPEMSETAFRGHLKEVLFKDDGWRRIREHIRRLADDIDGAEVDRKLAERDIEIGCARMIELGGYLNYLAAAKNASIANNANKANEANEAEKNA